METMSWDGTWQNYVFVSGDLINFLDFPEIRKRARNLESEIDMKLVALSKISSTGSGSEASPLLSSEFSFDTISMEIEDNLKKLGEMNEKMTIKILPAAGAAMMHTLTRHRDILNSYRSEFNKISSNHTIQVEREELLGILGEKNGNSSPGTALSRRDMYAKEQTHIAK